MKKDEEPAKCVKVSIQLYLLLVPRISEAERKHGQPRIFQQVLQGMFVATYQAGLQHLFELLGSSSGSNARLLQLVVPGKAVLGGPDQIRLD